MVAAHMMVHALRDAMAKAREHGRITLVLNEAEAAAMLMLLEQACNGTSQGQAQK
jgi:hypothetical protein